MSSSTELSKFVDVDEFAKIVTERQIDTELSLEKQLDQIVNHLNQAALSFLDAGLYLLNLRETSDHGAFISGLKARGINRHTANKLMQGATFICNLSEKDRSKMLKLNKSKVLELAKAEPDVVAELLEDDDFEDLQALSVRELREQLKQAQQKEAQATTALEIKEHEIKALNQSHADLEHMTNFPADVSKTRIEAAAMQRQASTALEELERMLAEHQGRDYEDPHHSELITRAIWMASNSLYALNTQFRTLMIDHYGDTLAGDVEHEDMLTAQEAIKLANDYSLITREHEHQKLIREIELQNKQPRGRGRPKKLKPES